MDRIRLYCDFNHQLGVDLFSMGKSGTHEDLQRLGVELVPGLQILAYDYDTLDDGSSAWIVADATIELIADIGFAARTDPGSFRWEPRRQHSALIHWSEQQQAKGLPQAMRSMDPSWLLEEPGEGWSLACHFRRTPREQGSPSSAIVEFFVADAPHDRLRAGTKLFMFERGTAKRALVEVLD